MKRSGGEGGGESREKEVQKYLEFVTTISGTSKIRRKEKE